MSSRQSGNGSVRHNRQLAFRTNVRDALAAPPAQRQSAVRRVLRRNPAAALSFLSVQTLKRVLVVMGYTAAVAGVVTRWPSPPRGGVANLAPTPAGNVSAGARSWGQRAWNMAPNRTRAINAAGAVATAVNPVYAIQWIVGSMTSRTIDATDRQIQAFEGSVNRARQQMEMYVSWALFIAFLAVISHFIPRLALNVRRTINVLMLGNADQALQLAGNVAQHAIAPTGGSRSRSTRPRSRSRSRSRQTRTLRIGAGAPVARLTLGPGRRMPTNAELLARLR